MLLLLCLLPGAFAITNSTELTRLFPYDSLASIYSSNYISGYSYRGAGVVIGPYHVLTTASLRTDYSAEDLDVRVGSISRPASGTTTEGFLSVANATNHPNYTAINQDYDYCILKLKNRVSVVPALLPTVAVSDSQPTRLIGWGKVDPKGKDVLIAREARVNLHRSCVDAWAGIHEITDRMNCNDYYLGSTASACYGDAGTPVYNDVGLVILGLSSFGTWSNKTLRVGVDACSSRPRPNVNSDVHEVVPWIEKTMAE